MANRRPSFWRGPPCACPKVAPDLYLVVGRTGPGDSTARGRRHGRVSAAGRGGRAVGSPENGVPKEKGDAGRDGVPRARRNQRRGRGTPYVPRPRGRRLRLIPRTGARRRLIEIQQQPGPRACGSRGRREPGLPGGLSGVVSSQGWAVSLNWTAPWIGLEARAWWVGWYGRPVGSNLPVPIHGHGASGIEPL
jgi:hypothetical protein